MALLTLAEAKDLLRITSTADDTYLTAWLDAASAAAVEFVGRELVYDLYTDYLSGNDQPYVLLRNRPIWTIVSVNYDSRAAFDQAPDAFDTDTLLTRGIDYALGYDTDQILQSVRQRCSRSGKLLRLNGVWQAQPSAYRTGWMNTDRLPAWGAIKVVYWGGYDPIPAGIKLAVAQMTSYLQRTAPTGLGSQLMLGERLKDYSYELSGGRGNAGADFIPELGSARQLLTKYRDLAW